MVVALETTAPVSRQRAYQLRRIAAGLCPSCGRKAAPGLQKCKRHAKKTRERLRKLFGYKRRNRGAKSYNLETKNNGTTT